MTVKEMNQKISTAIAATNFFLDMNCTCEEFLNACKYGCIAEEISKQIEFLRSSSKSVK